MFTHMPTTHTTMSQTSKLTTSSLYSTGGEFLVETTESSTPADVKIKAADASPGSDADGANAVIECGAGDGSGTEGRVQIKSPYCTLQLPTGLPSEENIIVVRDVTGTTATLGYDPQAVKAEQMSTAVRESLVNPPDGVIVYDTTMGAPVTRQEGVWMLMDLLPITGRLYKQYYRAFVSANITSGNKVEITDSYVTNGTDYLAYSSGVFSSLRQNYIYRLTWNFNPVWTGSNGNNYAIMNFYFGDGSNIYTNENASRMYIRRLDGQTTSTGLSRTFVIATGTSADDTSHYCKIAYLDDTSSGNGVAFTRGTGLLVEEVGPKFV